MSHPSEKSWTEEEKNFLLTEILKRAGISSAYLFGIIKEHHINPSWMDIPLPSGRSVHSCQAAFNRMESEYTQHHRRPTISGPMAPLHTSPGLGKRPFPSPSSQAPTGPRAIQPKPPNSIEGYATPEMRPPVAIPRNPDSTNVERPRKRGRPSKEEVRRRTLAAQNLSGPYNSPVLPSQRRPLLEESSPMATGPTHSPSLSEGVAQRMWPEQANRPQQIDPSTSQTPPSIEGRRMSGPGLETGVGPGPPGTTNSSTGPNESTPRTVLDARMPQSPVPLGSSLAPPFKMVNQPGSDSASPEAETSNTTATGQVVESTRSASGMEEAKDD